MVKQIRNGLLIHRLGQEEAARRGNHSASEKDIKRLGKGVSKALKVKADAGDTKAEEKLRAAIRPAVGNLDGNAPWRQTPMSKTHRQRLSRGISEGKVATIRPPRPLRRCELCMLLVHGRRFHRACYEAFARWLGQQQRRRVGLDQPPAFGDPRGRKVTPEILARNYGWLMAREISRSRTGKSATRRSLYGGTRSTVNEAIRSFVALLPGDWDLVFWPGHGSKANQTRQRLVPLPDVLEELIEAGERDELILRLLRFGMPEEQIVRITGASRERVCGVLAPLTPTESASASAK
jgi:hypothetical protein